MLWLELLFAFSSNALGLYTTNHLEGEVFNCDYDNPFLLKQFRSFVVRTTESACLTTDDEREDDIVYYDLDLMRRYINHKNILYLFCTNRRCRTLPWLITLLYERVLEETHNFYIDALGLTEPISLKEKRFRPFHKWKVIEKEDTGDYDNDAEEQRAQRSYFDRAATVEQGQEGREYRPRRSNWETDMLELFKIVAFTRDPESLKELHKSDYYRVVLKGRKVEFLHIFSGEVIMERTFENMVQYIPTNISCVTDPNDYFLADLFYDMRAATTTSGTADEYHFLPREFPEPRVKPKPGVISKLDRPISLPVDKHGNEVSCTLYL